MSFISFTSLLSVACQDTSKAPNVAQVGASRLYQDGVHYAPIAETLGVALLRPAGLIARWCSDFVKRPANRAPKPITNRIFSCMTKWRIANIVSRQAASAQWRQRRLARCQLVDRYLFVMEFFAAIMPKERPIQDTSSECVKRYECWADWLKGWTCVFWLSWQKGVKKPVRHNLYESAGVPLHQFWVFDWSGRVGV